MTFTIDEVASVVAGRVIHGDRAQSTTGRLFFDSRNPSPAGIFLALKGEHVDGHDFVINSGAALSIVTRDVAVPAIIVDDVLVAASKWAAHLRSQFATLTVIGITGSQGKTTTKDMLAHLLRTILKDDDNAVVAPSGSFNNDLGLPVVLSSCSSKTRFCVAEMGARHRGDIGRLAQVANPRIGVVLKVGSAHLGEFGSREAIAEAKSELVAGIAKDGIAILGTYDEFTPKMASMRSDLDVVTFGERGSETVRATDVEARGGFAHFELVTPRGREVVELRIAGMHNVANALAAAAVGFVLGFEVNDIATALSTFEPKSSWRMELQEVAGITVINDAYNANPESMRAALETTRLLAQESGGRTFAFLGTMNELGDQSDAMHREIGDIATELGIDYLIAVNEARYLAPSGRESDQVLVESLEAARAHFAAIEAGDCVLFKASRSVGLERLATEFVAFLRGREVESTNEMKGPNT